VVEARISASTNDLCDRLTQGLPGFESPAHEYCETLQVSVAFAVVKQAFEEF